MEEMLKKFIEPEMFIHIASTMARPNALVNEMIRIYRNQNMKFTFSVTAVHGNLHALALSHIAKKVITGFLGDNYPKPRGNRIYANVLTEKKPFAVEPVSLLTLIQRLMGGAMNLPYMTTSSLVGSDLTKINQENVQVVKTAEGEEICMVKSLMPEITLVHGICADRKGNVILSSPMGEGHWGCLAARKGVLVTVEKIVSDQVMQEYADRVVIPSNRVLGVCEVPFGGYPQSMRTFGIDGIQSYCDDYDYYVTARNAVLDESLAKQWMENVICQKNQNYKALISSEKMKEITQARKELDVLLPDTEITLNEILIILSARNIVRLVKEKKYRTILAGIGFSHIASWMAKRILEQEGIEIHIMAELGFYGVSPVDGDVFLFSQRQADEIEQRCDVLHTLGTQVGYQNQCLGVIGAAEIDKDGNINSSQLPDGTYMTGSGGANDIASVTDCMVVCTPGKRKLVDKVNFVTSPGKRVQSIVTTFGVFERDSTTKEFTLQTWYNAKEKYKDARTALQEYTQWNQNISRNLMKEEKISLEERQLVWQIDREGVYRK